MNVHDDTTLQPATAMEKKLSKVLDDFQSQIDAVQHMLHFLMTDLEDGFELNRALKVDGRTATFMFQTTGIEATLWLCAEALTRMANLSEAIDKQHREVNAYVYGREARS